MTWTYSGSPGASEKDQVRFLIQDTRSGRPLLSDEEIGYLLDTQRPLYDDPVVAAVWAAETIATRFTGQASSISADGVSVSTGNLREEYAALAGALRNRRDDLSANAPIPDAGGMAGMPYFGLGQFDNIRAGRQDYGGYGRHRPYRELEEWA